MLEFILFLITFLILCATLLYLFYIGLKGQVQSVEWLR